MTVCAPAPRHRSGSSALRAALSEIAFSVALFAAATLGGFALLVLLFKSGLLSDIDILFYRGVALCLVAAPATMAILAAALARLGRCRLHDVVAAGCLSFGVNLAVLVIFPVTVDRSISVFVLSYLANRADTDLTSAEVDAAFRDYYLGHLRQIDRRLVEQRRSGNVVEVDGRYRITAQGRAFLRTADWVAWAFDTNRGLIDLPAPVVPAGRPTGPAADSLAPAPVAR